MVSLDITDKEVVRETIMEVKSDAVIHCATWTAVDMVKDDDKVRKVRAVNAGAPRISLMPARLPTVRCSICPRTMCTMDRELSLGSQIARIIGH